MKTGLQAAYHSARGGTGYRKTNRGLYTHNKNVTGKPGWSCRTDREADAFCYTAGLLAAHRAGRDFAVLS